MSELLRELEALVVSPDQVLVFRVEDLALVGELFEELKGTAFEGRVLVVEKDIDVIVVERDAGD